MKVSYEKIMKKIEDIENKYDVDSIAIEDKTKMWNLIRVLLATYITKPDYIKNERKNIIKKIIFVLKETLSNNKLPEQIEICAVSDVESQKKEGEQYYDVYVDPLNEMFENYVVLDWPSAKAERHPVGKNHIPLKIPLSVLMKKVLPSSPKMRNKEILENLIKDFAREFTLDEKKLKKHVLKSIAIFKIIKEKTKKKLEIMNPSVVIFRAAHGRFQTGVVQACKEMGILTIELQHGLIYQYHYGYIKKTRSENWDCVTDMIFTWSDFFSDVISKGYLFKREGIRSVGFPYIEKIMMKKYPPSKKIKDFCKRFQKIVLVSGQASEYIDTFVREAAEKNKEIGYIYKPHPRDARQLEFIESNIILVERERNIYSLFQFADVNVAALSTTMLEALVFNLPSISIASDDIDASAMGLIDNETIFLVKNTDEFIEAISKIKVEDEKAKKRAEYFFKKNASANMKKTILKILGEKYE